MLITNLNDFSKEVYELNIKAGWWKVNPETGDIADRNIGELLMLVVSEVSEGMEGARKNLMDDKLPHRKMLEVELADAIIRIADIAGHYRFDLDGAISEKRAFNATRADHKIENRNKEGGKAF